jgi:glycine/D-amino acid oxidase-like deaminating enzyme
MRDDRHRVIVVGGGVVGLAAAAELLRRSPEVSVTVLERAGVGGGASAYAGTIDIPYCNTGRHRALVEASWAWHGGDATAKSTEYRRPIPITWYAEPGAAAAKLQESVLPPLSPHHSEEDGWPAPEGVEEYRGQAFVMDCPAWCRALVHEIESSGRGRVIEHAAVTSIEEAEHAVVCLGPWLPGWSGPAAEWARARGLRTKRVAGLNIAVRSGRRPQQAVAWPSRDMHFHPAFEDDGRGDYRMSFRHPVWDVDPDRPATLDGADLGPVHAFLDGLLGAGGWSVSGHRVLADTYTPDFTPVVDRCPALGRNVTVVTGTHGSGVRLAPGLAELAAGRVLDGLGLPAS